jgi:hypothetical protein
MTQKQVTGMIYNLIPQANRIEHQIRNEKNFFIFKGVSENYMVCHLSETSDSSHSEMVTTITECYDWINQNS